MNLFNVLSSLWEKAGQKQLYGRHGANTNLESNNGLMTTYQLARRVCNSTCSQIHGEYPLEAEHSPGKGRGDPFCSAPTRLYPGSVSHLESWPLKRSTNQRGLEEVTEVVGLEHCSAKKGGRATAGTTWSWHGFRAPSSTLWSMGHRGDGADVHRGVCWNVMGSRCEEQWELQTK